MTDYNHWTIIPWQLKRHERCLYAKASKEQAEIEFAEDFPGGITASGWKVRIVPLNVEYNDGTFGIRYGFVTS